MRRPLTTSRPNLVRAILITGFTGAVIVALYLIVVLVGILHVATPLGVLQNDAAQIIGPSAFQGGAGAAAFGFFMHLIVSLVWAAIFIFAALRYPALIAQPIVWGAVFGLIVMVVMQFVVVPLGHAPKLHPSGALLLTSLIAHVVFFGIPVALVARRTLT